jgi:hypothetical protein
MERVPSLLPFTSARRKNNDDGGDLRSGSLRRSSRARTDFHSSSYRLMPDPPVTPDNVISKCPAPDGQTSAKLILYRITSLGLWCNGNCE